MEARDLQLGTDGPKLLVPPVREDERGYLIEIWSAAHQRAAGVRGPFRQDNMSRSIAGTLRGLHYRVGSPEGKLVTVIRGAAYDVVVDVRASSPTLGQWRGTVLSDENHHQLWIPPGFAHGFLALSDALDVVYKVTELYDPGAQRVVRWDDPAIGIEWPRRDGLILSHRDATAPVLADAELLP